MAETLFGAIAEKFEDSPRLKVSIPGGLWNGIAQERVVKPFCVLISLGSTPMWMTGDGTKQNQGPYIEEEHFEFRVRSDDDATVFVGMKDLMDAFDWCNLTIASEQQQTVIGVKRTNKIGPFKLSDNPGEWQGNVEYLIWNQNELP